MIVGLMSSRVGFVSSWSERQSIHTSRLGKGASCDKSAQGIDRSAGGKLITRWVETVEALLFAILQREWMSRVINEHWRSECFHIEATSSV